MSELAPRTWPEMVKPTPEQWRDWFLANDAEQQTEIAERVLRDHDEATRCFLADHDHLLDEIQNQQQAMARFLGERNRYRLAWISCRRRGRLLSEINNRVGYTRPGYMDRTTK